MALFIGERERGEPWGSSRIRFEKTLLGQGIRDAIVVGFRL
jgi:hypothetical protein